MWRGELTEDLYNELNYVLCEKHICDEKAVKFVDDVRKKRHKLFWIMKIYCMNPFLYEVPLDEVPIAWLFETGALPFEISAISHEDKADIIEMIRLFDLVTTYALLKLTKKLCCICSNIKDEDHFTSTSYVAFRDINSLVNCSFHDAMISVQYDAEYKDVKNAFKDYDSPKVAIAYLIALVQYLAVARNCEAAVSYFEDIFEETDEQIDYDIVKAAGNKAYKEQKYSAAVQAYSKGLDQNNYSYYLLGNRAQAYIKLQKYIEAEIDSLSAIILKPTWSKGYYKLASSLDLQNKIHNAHEVASLGLKLSSKSPFNDYISLINFQKFLRQKCVSCPPLHSKEELDEDDDDVAVPDLESSVSDDASDIPDLTDSSEATDSEQDDQYNDENCNSERTLTNEEYEQIANAFRSTSVPKNIKKREKKKDTKNQQNKKKEGKKNEECKAKPDVHRVEDQVEDEIKMKKLLSFMEAGSKAVAGSNGITAMKFFHESLNLVKQQPQVYKLSETERVSLKYAYALACCSSDTTEDLNKAITYLNEILHDHVKIKFPAAYYGLGLTYYKMNRFKEALNFLKMLNFENEQDFSGDFYWPGTKDVIAETKHSKLKVLVEDLFAKCESPPPPAAICRYKECTLQPAIYYSDPSFKNFISLRCQEKCILQYHMSCWKTLKEIFKKTDKEFLDSHCLTPDCSGLIAVIEVIDKNGFPDKHFESEECNKSKKNVKQKKTKLEKKLEIKEAKKKRQLAVRSISESHDTDEISKSEDLSAEAKTDIKIETPTKEKCRSAFESKNRLEATFPYKTNATCNSEIKGKPDGANVAEHKTKRELFTSENASILRARYESQTSRDDDNKGTVKESYKQIAMNGNETKCALSADAKPFYIIKKDSDEKDADPKLNKHKEKKKQKKTLSIEEFRGEYSTPDISYYNEYQLRLHRLQESKRIHEVAWSSVEEMQWVERGPSYNICQNEGNRVTEYYESEVAQNELSHTAETLQDAVSRRMSSLEPIEDIKDDIYIKDYIYTKVENILKECGPVDIEDQSLLKAIEEFSPEAKAIIDDFGGFQAFIQQSPSFAIVSGKLCLFSEMINLYHEGLTCNNEPEEETGASHLNPNAAVYSPPKVISTSSLIAASDELSPTKPLVKQENTSKSLLSLVSNLRQDLSAYNFGTESIVNSTNTNKSDDMQVKHPSGTLNNVIHKEPVVTPQKSMAEQSVVEEKASQSDIPQVEEKCSQAGNPCLIMISRETMKEDEELQLLREELEEEQQKRELAEENLVNSLDQSTQMQNKINTEIPYLQKALEDEQIKHEEEVKQLKTRAASVEKDVKQWRQKYDAAMENERELKKQGEKLQVKVNRLTTKVEAMEKEKTSLEAEIETHLKMNQITEQTLKDCMEEAESYKQKICSATQRSKTAELEFVSLKKNEFTKRFDMNMKYVKEKVASIQDGISRFESSLQPNFATSFRAYHKELLAHIEKLNNIRILFLIDIQKQINDLAQDKSLNDLTPVPIPELPDLPVMDMPNLLPQTVTQTSGTSTTMPINQNPIFQNSISVPNMQHSYWNYNQLPQPTPLVKHNPYPLLTQVPNGYQQIHYPYYPQHHATAAVRQTSAVPVQTFSNSMYYQPQMIARPPGIQPGATSNIPLLSNLPAMGNTGNNSQSKTVSMSASASASSVSTAAKGRKETKKSLVPETASKKISADNSSLRTSTEKNLKSSDIEHDDINSVTNEICDNASNANSITSLDRIPCHSSVSSENGDKEDNVSVSSFRSISLPLSVKETGPHKNKVIQSSQHDLSTARASLTAASSKQSISSTKSEKPQTNDKKCPKMPVVNGSINYNITESISSRSERSNSVDSNRADKWISEQSIRPSDMVAESSKIIPPVKATTAADNPNQSSKKKNYQRLLNKLKESFPDLPENELASYVMKYREQKRKLTGIPIDDIIAGIGQIIKNNKQNQVNSEPPKRATRPKNLVHKPVLTPPTSPPVNAGGVKKSSITECPWAKTDNFSNQTQWSAEDYEKNCIICLEDMTTRNAYKVDCGHRFHFKCIRQWLDKTSNCPVCRVHLLLPEDYPQLAS